MLFLIMKVSALLVFMNNSKLNKQQWLERDQKLNKIVNWAKKNKTSSYDCIIPISGGKDSY